MEYESIFFKVRAGSVNKWYKVGIQIFCLRSLVHYYLILRSKRS